MITVSIIFFFAPVYGFMACAWASFVCNLVMMITSYVMGKRRLAVPYDIGSALRAVVITFFIYGISIVIRDFFPDLTFTVTMVYRTVLLLLFVLFIYRYER